MPSTSSVVTRARHIGGRCKRGTQRVLSAAGARQPETRIAADAQSFWSRPAGPWWEEQSHWRGGPMFATGDLWSRLGRDHLELVDKGARAVGWEWQRPRVVDWGCGGGANAVHLAPRASEFIGVDIAEATVDECRRQVATVCSTPFTSVVIEVNAPESAAEAIKSCDLFVSFYVFELIPTPEYGERLLRIAAEALVPGGLAVIQIRYSDGTWRTGSRRRSYRSGFADMTTYRIDEFWELSARCGLVPHLVTLVPRNELDRRYAYFVLSKPAPS